MKNLLQVNAVYFKYPNQNILQDINFTLQKGEILAVVGESGCGKTTLLKCIQGLLPLQKGEIFFNNQLVPNPEDVLVPGVEGIETVYQDFNLQNGLTVFHNIKHHINHLKLNDQYEFTQELIDLCGMNDFADKKPLEISGGQKQKTALAMALVSEPDLILLDEPFSHLDQISKTEFIKIIKKVRDELNISFVFVTHNYNEALSLADKILVLHNGKQKVYALSNQVFNKKLNSYTAKLLGKNNIIEGEILVKLGAKISSKYNYHIPQNAIQIVSQKTKSNWLSVKQNHPFLSKFVLFNSALNIELEYWNNTTKMEIPKFFNVIFDDSQLEQLED
jgi:iron(III) transport system ATP-binding protein